MYKKRIICRDGVKRKFNIVNRKNASCDLCRKFIDNIKVLGEHICPSGITTDGILLKGSTIKLYNKSAELKTFKVSWVPDEIVYAKLTCLDCGEELNDCSDVSKVAYKYYYKNHSCKK
jgi:hypothetical protein